MTKKVSLPGFVVGGPISFANMAIIVNKGKADDLGGGEDETGDNDEEGEEENKNLDEYLANLHETCFNYIKHDSGEEIKKNFSKF
ncbi:MAG: hypothetical protein NY202_03510 [Mollicutes bacterium UO1]